LALPQHVLRFWETRFPQIKPLKRAGGRRYYRPEHVEALRAVKERLYDQGYTIKGVQKLIRAHGLAGLREPAAAVAPLFDETRDRAPPVLGHAGPAAPTADAPGPREDIRPSLRAALAELDEARRVLALAAAP
jgi:DNA-binding transcriptional MerR regulator